MNDFELIEVTPVENVFSITWNISLRCNYDCMYCPPVLHDNHSKHLTLDQFKQYWKNIHDKTSQKKLKYKLSFTRGRSNKQQTFLTVFKVVKRQL